jgi:tetratricopeptide (TPR) repeat protein
MAFFLARSDCIGEGENNMPELDNEASNENGDPEVIFKRGNALIKEGHYSAALQDISEAIRLSLETANPDDEKLERRCTYYNNRIITLNRLRRHKEALADCNEGLKISADNRRKSSFLRFRAIAHYGTARFDEALADISQAIALDPEKAERNNKWSITAFGEIPHDWYNTSGIHSDLSNGIACPLLDLTEVVIPSTVRQIGASAFQGQTNLKTVILPDGLNYIGRSAFYGCESLESITIPGKVKEIGEDAFRWCDLKNVTIKDGVETIGNQAFSGLEVESLVLPNSVHKIGSMAFWTNGRTIKNITIGKNAVLHKQSFTNYFADDYKEYGKKAGVYICPGSRDPYAWHPENYVAQDSAVESRSPFDLDYQ